MNRLFITGDKHGSVLPIDYDVDFHLKTNTDETDLLVILGDFGLVWGNYETIQEKRLVNLIQQFPFKVLFVDGNHENHPRLYQLPSVEMFGGRVGKYNDQIFHLKRGEIYNIFNKKIFVMGGAVSVDKLYRQEYISWWKEETPSLYEFNLGLENLIKNNKSVDYVFGHTGPKHILEKYAVKCGWTFDLIKDKNSDFFDHITSEEFGLDFKKFYFGHMHDNCIIDDKYQILYEQIIELKDIL